MAIGIILVDLCLKNMNHILATWTQAMSADDTMSCLTGPDYGGGMQRNSDNQDSCFPYHVEPEDEAPVRPDGKVSYNDSVEPEDKSQEELDETANFSNFPVEPANEVSVQPQNKTRSFYDPLEANDEASMKTKTKTTHNTDPTKSVAKTQVDPEDETSFSHDPLVPDEAPAEADSYCKNSLEYDDKASEELDLDKVSSSIDYRKLDSETPVEPDCSDPSEPSDEAPVKPRNKTTTNNAKKSDGKTLVKPDDETNSLHDPVVHDKAQVEPGYSNCMKPDFGVMAEPCNKASFIEDCGTPVESDYNDCSSESCQVSEQCLEKRLKLRVPVCNSPGSLNANPQAVAKFTLYVAPVYGGKIVYLWTVQLQLKDADESYMMVTKLVQVYNVVTRYLLSGNRKKLVASVKPRTQSKTGDIAENMQDRDDSVKHHDCLDDDQSDDNYQSSGSELSVNVPESSGEEEEDDDDDDDTSVVFPLLNNMHEKMDVDSSMGLSQSIFDLNVDLITRIAAIRNTVEQKILWETNTIQIANSSKASNMFNPVKVESYEKKNGKRNYRTLNFCFYCKNQYNSKISKHLMSVHFNEERVQKISNMPVGSVERKMCLQKLQKEGNYDHNAQVLKNGKGTLVVYRRPSEISKVCASEYLPCEYCLGFFHEKQLWIHAKSCYFREVAVDTPANYVRNGRIMMAPYMIREESEIGELDLVIAKMKETVQNPGLKQVCAEDELIREFGLSQLDKLGTKEEQRRKDQDNIRTKMRSIARLLSKLNEKKLRDVPLSNYICGKEFMNVVATVKLLSRESNSPNLATNLGHYLKQIALLKGSLGLQKDDATKYEEAKVFQELYTTHWNSKVSAVANRTKRLRCINKKEELPSTEDLVKLKEYLMKEIHTGIKKINPTYEEYVRMTQIIMARIVLFNKRRISEVDELKVNEFDKRIKGDDVGNNAEIISTLGLPMRYLIYVSTLCCSIVMHLVEVRGKSTRGLRKVYILLTPDMVDGINFLLTSRIHAGINPENVYVFGRTTSTPQDGCTAMRMVSEACPGLSNPDLIRTRLLRKYMATTSQIMDMTADELKLVADHMGHSVAIHTNVYTLQTSILERTKVARALVALENGKLNGYKGKRLESISLEGWFTSINVSIKFNLLSFGYLEAIMELFPYGIKIPQPVEEEDDPENEDLSDTSVAENENVTGIDQEQEHREHSNETKSKVIKRKRWTEEEESSFSKAFKRQIQEKSNATTKEIRDAIQKFGNLNGRSEAMIRSKLNNIIHGKCIETSRLSPKSQYFLRACGREWLTRATVKKRPESNDKLMFLLWAYNINSMITPSRNVKESNCRLINLD
ncbi:hypothetical protein KUTeg_007308 [Tegillarca granosa]|uniref:Uncharacterized protein n=1 Tax=Tegillarca granosa TaxID=220873 RepID=A0ABQ9FCW3_TEGGR|nr:hypothetical protein KUTeg_007308 [Tegillarca granosa]